MNIERAFAAMEKLSLRRKKVKIGFANINFLGLVDTSQCKIKTIKHVKIRRRDLKYGVTMLFITVSGYNVTERIDGIYDEQSNSLRFYNIIPIKSI